jgi:hypothetical protein
MIRALKLSPSMPVGFADQILCGPTTTQRLAVLLRRLPEMLHRAPVVEHWDA